MKIAILTNREDSYPRPMAEGLARMLGKLGVRADLFYSGLRLIRRFSPAPAKASVLGAVRALKQKGRKLLLKRLIARLKDYDAVVIVNHIPAAFLRGSMDDELLRAELPATPIVLYDLVYLPTRGDWARLLKIGSPENGIHGSGHYGMERYDWYLCVSVVSEFALPGGPQPYSRIGIDLDDGSLFPGQNGRFVALLDFERPGHERERAIQKEALRDTNTAFIELKGHYKIDEIRRLYRQCSLYFIAHRESFGLPICELQACGAYIFTPYAAWCPSHWLKADLSQDGPGVFSDNFVVYNNDKAALINEIQRLRNAHDPAAVRQRFLGVQPELFRGSLDALQSFLDEVRQGAIHSRSHSSHHQVGLPEK